MSTPPTHAAIDRRHLIQFGPERVCIWMTFEVSVCTPQLPHFPVQEMAPTSDLCLPHTWQVTREG